MKKVISILSLAAIGSFNCLDAQQSQWKNYFSVYFLGAAMDGNAAIGGLAADVDLSFSDIVDNLEFGAMANYRAENDQMSVGLDLIYMGLGATTPGGNHLDYDQWMVEGNIGWRATDTLEFFAGVRYNDVGAKITANTTPFATVFKASDGWFDPIVGTRLWLPVSDSLSCIIRGDVGGFGVGSDLTWQLSGFLRYAPSSMVSLLVGYRYYDIDYEDGTGVKRFVYDMTIQGPAAGVTFQF